MFSFDVLNKEIKEIPLEGFNGVFHPHGINVFHSPSGKIIVFIVNHQHENMSDQVLLFEYLNSKL